MLTDILETHFVELPKFIEEQLDLNNSLSKWLTFLTKPEKKVMEVVEMGEPAIRKAITVLDMLSRDPETVRLAELRMKKLLDEKSMMEGAKEEGREEGREEGKKVELYNTVIKLLTKRFGTLPEKIQNRLSSSNLDTLEVIVDDIFDFNELKDLEKYLK